MTLPTPDPAFRWSIEPWGHALRCRPLESVAQHLFTTKQLRLRGSPPLDWRQAAASVGALPQHLMTVRQVHGREVRILRKGEVRPTAFNERPEADALISNEGGLVLVVGVADCVPLLVADPRTGAVAAIHAGWRGTCAGVARATIEAMTREFGSRPTDLLAALGPSIGVCCYEVGDELIDAFRAAGFSQGQLARWFSRTNSGSLRLDVVTANRDQINEIGVPRAQIYSANLCTKTHAELFDSFRADGPKAGRMAGLIKVVGVPQS